MRRAKTVQSSRKVEVAEPKARVRIVSAAREHFFQHGFHRVTMDDLARELGLSKKTLYASFVSKEALLEAVLAEKFAGVEAALQAAARAHRRDFSAALHAMLAAMHDELGELQPPFVRDMRRKAPHVFKHLEERRARIIHANFGRLLRQGQREGAVRKDVSAELMIETLLFAINGVVNPIKLEQLRLSPRDAFHGVIELILHGAFGKGGRK